MYVHTHARTQVQLSYLGALVMNHHQVVDDVQSKLPRGVQLQDVALFTGSLPEQTWQRVSHTHTCTWSKYVTFAAQKVRNKIILITERELAHVCVCTWVGDTAPPQHRGCWLSSSGASGTWQRADRSWRTHRQVRQAELVGGARIPGSDSSTMRTYMVAMAMSLSDRVSLAGFGTTGSSISNLDILDMVPFWKRWTPGQMTWCVSEPGEGGA